MVRCLGPAVATSLRRFIGDEGGATAIEYALIASGISVAIVGTIAVVGTDVKNFYTSVNTALK